jgi:hypothetical protein
VLTGQALIPELGPSLGRLTDPSSPPAPASLAITCDDIRLDLVTGIFELAGAARGFAASGDNAGAMASLGRASWLGLWERATCALAERVGVESNAVLRDAAAESHFPERTLTTLLLTPADVHSIAVRLGSGGAPFVAALDTLELAARSARGEAQMDEWRAALEAAARRLESAWLSAVGAAAVEEQQFRRQAELVRAWRRPTWPLWLVTVIVVAAAAYVGLVIGGYVPVPRWLRGVAEFWWGLF